MTDPMMTLLKHLRKQEIGLDADFSREAVQRMMRMKVR